MICQKIIKIFRKRFDLNVKKISDDFEKLSKFKKSEIRKIRKYGNRRCPGYKMTIVIFKRLKNQGKSGKNPGKSGILLSQNDSKYSRFLSTTDGVPITK